jgi:formamidopyrimidine-DNA glycosylase
MTLAETWTSRQSTTCPMPELPDITVYVESLESRIAGATLKNIRLNNAFVLRTATPPIALAAGRHVTGVRRMGKRIVISLQGDCHLVIHLMVAGRLKWLPTGGKPPGKSALAVFEFDTGSLVFTEAGTRRRASLHFVTGITAVEALHAGGIELFGLDLAAFARRLRAENHTLKRALTDPHIFSGIGNAYSDEILHHARLSPIAMSAKLSDDEVARLFDAARATLSDWTHRLRKEAGNDFPEKVTAFRDGMAVHGRYGLPCPVCGSPVQRIVYAANETNYCARCQTGGKILADRALSRLLKKSWPRSIDELG